MKRTRQGGFTLTEVLTALSVGTLVLAGVMIVFVQVQKGWRTAAVDMELLGESRLIRERMVRGLGVGGTVGLREASLSSLSITTLDANHQRVSFLNGTNSCFITETNFGGVTWNVVGGAGGVGSALMPNAPYNTFASQLLISTGTDNTLSINMLLGAINQGATNFYPQIIKVRLINP